MLVFLRWHLKRENKKKDFAEEVAGGMKQLTDAQSGVAQDQKFVHAFDDLTDRENINFRYIF